MKKLVLFGAGKIGRSFIGQLFSQSGYEVVFIDINEAVIKALNDRKKYKVVIKGGENENTILVENVRGVLGTNQDKVIQELVSCDVAAVSVGQKGLAHILPVIAKALIKRNDAKKSPLDIIIAENMRNADLYIHSELQTLLPTDFPINTMVGLVETSIGKMVPIMPREEEEKDILQVFAESYNTLIVDKKAFKNPLPQVEGLAAKENMKAWVDRKSFIHNFGHAALAYIGYMYNPQFKYLYEALGERDIKIFTRDAMLESAAILNKKYPNEFYWKDLVAHIDDLIQRFENRDLGDTIFRVGCDLPRKLGRHDRVVAVLMEGIEMGMPVDCILFTLACGYRFRAQGENGEMFPADAGFVKELQLKGFANMLNVASGIPYSHNNFTSKAVDWYNKINNSFKEQIKSLFLTQR